MAIAQWNHPVSIPNPEVKRCSADGSAAKGRVRVGRCQNLITTPHLRGGFFCPFVLVPPGASIDLSIDRLLESAGRG